MTKKKPNPFVQSILNTSVDSAQNIAFHKFQCLKTGIQGSFLLRGIFRYFR